MACDEYKSMTHKTMEYNDYKSIVYNDIFSKI